MKLTQKQQEVINRFLELEKEYGKGNVFIRWINNYWNTMFVIHQKDAETFEPHLTDSFKVNGRVLNALTEKGLIKYMDIHHEKIEEPNAAMRDGKILIGGTIVLYDVR